jgi:hypothetical protein
MRHPAATLRSTHKPGMGIPVLYYPTSHKKIAQALDAGILGACRDRGKFDAPGDECRDQRYNSLDASE